MSKAKKIDWREYWPYLAIGVVSLVFLVTTLKGKGKKGATLPLDDETMDYRGQPNQPRGIRNNNPGNIVIAPNDWKGKVPVSQNTDGKFEQFVAYEYGLRAMIVLLINYINRNGLKTMYGIVNRWCSGGCDLNTYMVSMTQSTGFSADQTLVADRETIKRLVRGIVRVELGMVSDVWVDDSQFDKAWSLL